MGKAAQRRKDSRIRYLAKLSQEDPVRFDWEWEIRVQSWIDEIQGLGRDWKEGATQSKRRIFEVCDEAISILRACERSVYEKYAEKTYEVIVHECCVEVSRVVDPRLYRLSNHEQLIFRARKSARA